MSQRKKKPAEEIPDPGERQRCRFPMQWDKYSQDQINREHKQAKVLVTKGHGFIDWSELVGRR